MTFPIQIEHGNHMITIQTHAVPSVGDTIICALPSVSDEVLVLRATRISFRQHRIDANDPLLISVVTEGHPEHRKHNEAIFAVALGTKKEADG